MSGAVSSSAKIRSAAPKACCTCVHWLASIPTGPATMLMYSRNATSIPAVISPRATSWPPYQSTTIDEKKPRKPMIGNIVAPMRERSIVFLNVKSSFSWNRAASYSSRVNAWTTRTSAIASCSTPTASPCASCASRERSRIFRPMRWPRIAIGGATTSVSSASRQFMRKMTATPPTSVRTCPRTWMIVCVTTP